MHSPRYVKQMTRQDMVEYLLMVLTWDGVVGEKDLMAEAVQRWADTPGLSLVDAYLATLAVRSHCPVFTKNLRSFAGKGPKPPTRCLMESRVDSLDRSDAEAGTRLG